MSGLPQIAVIADPHVHFAQAAFGGAGMDVAGQRLCLRYWGDTRAGDRVINESLPAFRACLADIRARGIRDVVLLGDLTDDGQRANVAAMAELLAAQADLRFFALPGNHDCFAVAGKHVTTAFLGPDGGVQTVTSDPAAGSGAVVTDAMRCDGIVAALRPFASHGFTRQRSYLHWETPFGAADDFAARLYAATSPDGGVRHVLADASYLVEPVAGLWLLMLDANVFAPRDGIADPARKRAFRDAAQGGWPALLGGKPHLMAWIGDVVARAQALRKMLLTFSHYPVVPPEAPAPGWLCVPQDPVRAPGPEVARALAGLGVTQHFSGHLHLCSERQAEGVTNIAVPSPVSFPGGYLVIRPGEGWEAVAVDAPLDPDLRAVYRRDTPDTLAGLLEAQLRARVGERFLRKVPAALRAQLFAGAPDADLALRRLLEDWHIHRKGGRLAPARLRALDVLAAAAGTEPPAGR